VLAACSFGGNATVIQFEEREAGSEKYRSRMIVTPGYMRIDEGEDSTDFVLFDRKKRVIYSTNSLDKRTLVIKWREMPLTIPDDLKNRVEELKEAVPPIADNPVTHYRLYTNNKICYDLFAAKGLLPKAAQAMIEFQQTLAVEHADFMLAMPLQTASACDRINNVFDPARYLKYGFPVRASDYLGRSRQLVDYRTGEKVGRELFALPEDFEQYTAQSMRAK
jgi:hypothetical protein